MACGIRDAYPNNRPMAAMHGGDPGCKVHKDPKKVIKPGVILDLEFRFLENGPDMTVDIGGLATEYARTAWIKGRFHCDNTVGEVKERLSEQEGVPVTDMRFFCPPHEVPDHVRIRDCYVNWNGYGMVDWPPRYVVKHGLQGFEVVVHVPAMRDTTLWEKYALDPKDDMCNQYIDRYLIFDVDHHTTVKTIKDYVEKNVGIAAWQQQLYAAWKWNEASFSTQVEMEDEQTMADHEMESLSMIWLNKRNFDKDGLYIFDDAYWEQDKNGKVQVTERPAWSSIQGNMRTKWKPG